jgi:DNA-binding SARP family transcriptional activator
LAAGIEVAHVQNLIRKRKLTPPPSAYELESWPWPIKVYTLGRFEILKDGEPLQYSRKAQKRPLEMLKILVSQSGREVSEENVADNLWPEGEGDAAHHAFATNLHRLRELLGSEGAIRHQDGKLNLNPQYCWTDAEAFDRLYEEAKPLWEKGARSKNLAFSAERVLHLYRGHFLPADEGAPWSLSCRERLRNRFIRLVLGLGGYFEEQKRWKEAAEYYERGIEVDDLIEEFYQYLILCFQSLDQLSRAIETYQRCRKTLHAVFGIPPSPKTQTIYKTLLEKAHSKF